MAAQVESVYYTVATSGCHIVSFRPWQLTKTKHKHNNVTLVAAVAASYLDTVYPLIWRNFRMSCAFSLSFDFSLAVRVS